jgi:hypothetical protein
MKRDLARIGLAGVFIIALIAGFSRSCRAEDAKGELYFTFVSSAYYMDKKWGHGMPLDGIKRVAQVAHSNGVPVTWLVSPRSAEEGRDLFREYHDNYGDAFGYMINTTEDEETKWGGGRFFMQNLPQKKLYARLKSESDAVRSALPWADVIIGGGGIRSNIIVRMLEKLGFKGLWGHCWEQTLTDEISDRGTPWGFYYASPDAYKAPGRGERGLVGIEWTARDLNLSFRTGKPETYSTDPNDVGRAGICAYRQIDYWKRMVDQYARNTKYNKMVPLAVHQEAHEMENSDKVRAYNPEDIESTTQMLDELFKYVKSTGARIVNANDAILKYRELYAATPPTYALFDDVLLNKYPTLLVYFDVNGQMFFDRGKRDPLLIRNYAGKLDPEQIDFAGVKNPPPSDCRESKPGVFACAVKSDSDLAYGMAFWGDHKSISVSGVENPTTRILDGELAFVSWVLKPGENKIAVTLQ